MLKIVPMIPVSRKLLLIHGFFDGVAVPNQPFSLFLVQIIISLLACRAVAQIGFFFNQPRVVFEKIGGILIGPSVFSQKRAFAEELFPVDSWKFIVFASGIGIQMYMLLIGMQLNVKLVLSSGSRSIYIAVFSILVPFVFGFGISPIIYNTMQRNFDTPRNDPTTFSIFLGMSMGITAFPMLSRMLKETGLVKTKVGMTTLSAAALNDALAWLLLICTIALANSTTSEAMGWMFLSIISYAVFLFTIVRSGLHHLVRHIESSYDHSVADHHLFALVLIGTTFSGWICTMFGLSALIGAFLFGVIVPRKTRLHAACLFNMEEFINTHFLPLYFALSGLRTDFTTLNVKEDLPLIFLVCLVATFGKLLGAGVPALMCGFKLRESAVIAVLMNTRGLLELIMLNVGIRAGVLNSRVFSVMVIMCMFTSITAYPIVQCIYPEHFRTGFNIVDRKASPSRPDENGPVNASTAAVDDGIEMVSTPSSRHSSPQRNSSEYSPGKFSIMQGSFTKHEDIV